MAFERKYQLKILSKQLNKQNYSTLSQTSLNHSLNPWFITGFTDAEGCFSFGIKPALCTRKTHEWVKLSNSGDTLKLMIPNYGRKAISGWTNQPCMVTTHKMNENEMSYRGSKSEILYPQPNEFSVKEQRVDGSYCKKNKLLQLRCTLMAFERKYQLKILSKQLNKQNYSTLSQTSLNHSLNPWFITGFTDAEGCFSFGIKPALCTRKTHEWVKLSNSGDTLKLMIPNYGRKAISGWTNQPCMVTTHKMNENEMSYRGSKSEILYPQPNEFSVKEQRVDGSYCKKK